MSARTFFRLPELLYELAVFMTRAEVSRLSRCSRSLKSVLDNVLYTHVDISLRTYMNLPVKSRSRLQQTLISHAEQVRRLSIRSSRHLERQEGFQRLQKDFMVDLVVSLPALYNLQRIDFCGFDKIPLATVLSLWTLPKLRELRLPSRSFSRETAQAFQPDSGSMHTLHLQRISSWTFVDQNIEPMNLQELTLQFEPDTIVDASWFSRFKLRILRLRGGVIQERCNAPSTILHTVLKLEVMKVNNLGWLNALQLQNLREASFRHVADTNSVSHFLASSPSRRLKSLTVVLVDAVFFPNSLAKAICEHGRSLERLWLDNELTRPHAKHTEHLAHLSLDQWRSIAASLTSIRTLAVRPWDDDGAEWHASTPRMKLIDLAYPLLPTLQTLQPLGESRVTSIESLLHAAQSRFLFDTRNLRTISHPPRLCHVILDSFLYGVRYAAGRDARLCPVRDRVSLFLKHCDSNDALY